MVHSKRIGMMSRWSAGPLALALVLAPVNVFAADAKKAEAKPTEAQIAHISLDESIPESPQPTGLLGEQDDNLRMVQERIEKAGKDAKIRALFLKFGGESIGWGKANELRIAINKYKKSGKKVYAIMEEAAGPGYVLATAADEIVLPPSGWLMLTGMRMEVSFYKNLLDKLGVKADILQVGNFKGAAEPYTRDSMSEQLKSQLSSVLDDLYDQMIGIIAESRRIEATKIRELIDNGPYSAEDAKKAGLIDRVEYSTDLRDRLKKELNVDKLVFKMNYGRRDVDAELDGLAGLMKIMSSLSHHHKKDSTASGFNMKPKLALIYASGPIMTGKSESSFGESTIGSDTLVKAIREAGENNKVVAVVLRVDSPGGSALASDLIWHELRRIKKPIVVSMGNTAASGGYYISMGANKIFAEPGTITGSIGVVGGKVALRGLFEKVGVGTEVIARGKNSGILSIDTPFTVSERDAFQRMLNDIYKQFTTKAAEGRNMPIENLEKLAGGRIWTGRQAKANGLIDEVGTLEDAIAAAKTLSNMKPDDAYDLEILPKAPTAFEAIFGDIDDSLPRDAQLLERLFPEVKKPLSILKSVRSLTKEPAALITPYVIEIK